MTGLIAESSPHLADGVFNRLLPRPATNTFSGYKPALWLLALLVLVRLAMGLGCIFNGYTVATAADGIPLATFTATGAQAVLALFAIWGVGQVIFSLVGVLVLFRYRSMVPFMFAVLLLEQLSRKLVLQFLPIVRMGTPSGFYVNLGLTMVMIAGLALSLWSRNNRQASDS